MNNSHSTAAGLVIGIVIAAALGAAWKHNRLTRADLIDTKAKVWRLRRAYWIDTMATLIKWAVAVTLALLVTAAWVRAERNGQPLVPARDAATPHPKHPYTPKTFG